MKLLFIMLLGMIFISCDDSDSNKIILSNEQINFIKQWQQIRDNYNSASTTARQRMYFEEHEKHIDNISFINNWYGVIEDVGTYYITVNSYGIEYNLYPKGDISYIDYDKDMKIWFSGKLNGDEFLSTVKYPKLKVDCLKIINEDKTKTLFQLTQKEIKRFEKGLEFKQELWDIFDETKKEMRDALEKEFN